MEQAVVIDEWMLVREGVAAVLASSGVGTRVCEGTAMEGLIGLECADVSILVVGSCADSATIDVVRRAVAINPAVRVVALVGAVSQRALVELCSAGSLNNVESSVGER